MRKASLAERNINFGVAAGYGGVHHAGDALKVQSDARPFRRASQNDKRDFSLGEVLLIAHSPVGREQKINSRFLCGIKQRAIGEPIPSSGLRRNNSMAKKRRDEALGRSVVKENEHQWARMAAALALKP